jgi:hypothetical protein
VNLLTKLLKVIELIVPQTEIVTFLLPLLLDLKVANAKNPKRINIPKIEIKIILNLLSFCIIS